MGSSSVTCSGLKSTEKIRKWHRCKSKTGVGCGSTARTSSGSGEAGGSRGCRGGPSEGLAAVGGRAPGERPKSARHLPADAGGVAHPAGSQGTYLSCRVHSLISDLKLALSKRNSRSLQTIAVGRRECQICSEVCKVNPSGGAVPEGRCGAQQTRINKDKGPKSGPAWRAGLSGKNSTQKPTLMYYVLKRAILIREAEVQVLCISVKGLSSKQNKLVSGRSCVDRSSGNVASQSKPSV